MFIELSKQLNMQGVFLHVLSDAIGSVIVIVTALVCWLIPGQEALKLYLDPSLRFFFAHCFFCFDLIINSLIMRMS